MMALGAYMERVEVGITRGRRLAFKWHCWVAANNIGGSEGNIVALKCRCGHVERVCLLTVKTFKGARERTSSHPRTNSNRIEL